jgi:hypothetical protein
MATWYQCEECIFATNSPKAAHKHGDDTGHQIHEEAFDREE